MYRQQYTSTMDPSWDSTAPYLSKKGPRVKPPKLSSSEFFSSNANKWNKKKSLLKKVGGNLHKKKTQKKIPHFMVISPTIDNFPPKIKNMLRIIWVSTSWCKKNTHVWFECFFAMQRFATLQAVPCHIKDVPWIDSRFTTCEDKHCQGTIIIR